MMYERHPTDFGWGGLVGVTYDSPGKDTIRAEMTTHKTMSSGTPATSRPSTTRFSML